jgi:hypothetical protein
MEYDNDPKSLKERIHELEDRVEKLEKAEHKRKVQKFIGTTIKIAVIVVTVIAMYKTYQMVNEKIIKPYKDMVSSINNKYTEITDSEAYKNINDILNSDIFKGSGSENGNNNNNTTNQDWTKIFGQ